MVCAWEASSPRLSLSVPLAPRPRHGRAVGTIRAMDPFAALGLPPGASAEEVSVAYRELAKRWHPHRLV